MLLLIILLTFSFPLVYKYSFVITNQYSQIPIILSFLDPAYLQNDWYVQASRQFGPRTIFAFYMSLWARFIPLHLAFLLHYLLYIFFSALAFYKLSFLLIKKEWPAFLTTIIVIFSPTLSLGSNMLITRDFVAPQLPLGLSILAVSFLVDKKYILSAVLLSVSSYLHPLIGFESALIFYTAYFLSLNFTKQSTNQLLLKSFFPFIFFSSPGAYIYLKEAFSKDSNFSKAGEIVAFMRNPHHFIPSHFPISDYLLFFLMLIVFTVSLIVLKKYLLKDQALFLLYSTGIILIFCLFGWIGTEIISFYPIIALQTFRTTVFLHFIAYTTIVSAIFIVKNNKKFIWIALIFLILANFKQLIPLGKVKFAATFLFGISIYLLIKKHQMYQAAIILLLSYSLLFFHKKINISSYSYIDSDETEIAKWAKKETKSDASFLIPPEFESFRLIAERAVVVDWKSFPFQKQSMIQWAERICAISNTIPCNFRRTNYNTVVQGYRKLEKEDVLSLKEKYSFTYFVSDRKYEEFNKIYSSRFNVYDFEPKN